MGANQKAVCAVALLSRFRMCVGCTRTLCGTISASLQPPLRYVSGGAQVPQFPVHGAATLPLLELDRPQVMPSTVFAYRSGVLHPPADGSRFIADAKAFHQVNLCVHGRPALQFTDDRGKQHYDGGSTVRAARKRRGLLNAIFCDVFEMENTSIKRLITYLAERKDRASGSNDSGA